jgi:hypothetical protein
MSQHPAQEPYRGGDYEYDEAHAAAGLASSGGDADERQRPVYVSTQTPGYGGDYSYDMAHDVPPGRPG